MKTIKFICALVALLSSTLVFAEEIPLFKSDGDFDEKGPDRRTLVCEPTAAIDGINIILYSDVAMEMSVCIYDSNDNLVQTLTLICNGETDFELIQTIIGEYRIEIACGEGLYYGWFTLN